MKILVGSIRKSGFDVADYVHNRAVAVHHHSDHFVPERQRVCIADDAVCLFFQRFDVHNLQPGLLKTLCKLRTARIDSNAIFGYDYVYCRSRSDKGGYLVHYARYAATEKRAYYDGKCGIRCSVGMAADGSAYDSVASNEHVHVEVDVHLKGGKNHNVKIVHCGAGVVGSGVFYCGNLFVHRIVLERFCGNLAE